MSAVPALAARGDRDPITEAGKMRGGRTGADWPDLASREPVRLAGLPPPWDALDWRWIATKRNSAKALPGVAQYDGTFVVCKDRTGALTGLGSTYVRWTHRNEARALAALDGVPGIPRLLAEWPSGLVMSMLPGRRLRDLPRRQVPEHVLDRLEAIVEAIHARGFVVGDIHRNNILVADDGTVGLVDFENAVDVRTGWPRLLRRPLLGLDHCCLAKIRRQLGLPLDDGHRRVLSGPIEFLSRGGRAWRSWVHDRRRTREGRQRAR